MKKIALAIVTLFAIGAPAYSASAPIAPTPAPFPGVKVGEAVLRLGPGVKVDADGIHVNCDYSAPPAVNIIVDGEGTLVPISCT